MSAASVGFTTAASGPRSLYRAPSCPGNRRVRLAALGVIACVLAAALPAAAESTVIGLSPPAGQSRQPPPPHKWTSFVSVEGQPEPVPAEWVATPEGRFAHSIRIPNPVPKDSGYRWWMSAQDYFKHLCDTEAGEFIYEKVENVEGFLFMRPPGRPDDSDLMDKYKLEAPGFEAPFSIRKPDISERGSLFVSPSHGGYQYIEEPTPTLNVNATGFLEARGDGSSGIELKQVRSLEKSQSTYALTWRGIRRKGDRVSHIAGFEAVVLVRDTGKAIAVWRDYLWSRDGGVLSRPVVWQNAAYCPQTNARILRPEHEALRQFVKRVLVPKPRTDVGVQ